MRIVQITNWHRHGGGSDFIAQTTTELLRSENHYVLLMAHDSRSLQGTLKGKVEAFARGIYSPRARTEMRETIRSFNPDIVHVHELYPFHSPWVLEDCSHSGIPVVMTCHDFRLTCPVATHLHNGKRCDRCARGATYWCAVKNCRGNILESVAYAARSGVANLFRLYKNNVSLFIAPSHFVRDQLVAAGFPEERFVVIANTVASVDEPVDPCKGTYIAYAGRIAPEKGVDTLLEAARLTGLPVHIAGGEMSETIPDTVCVRGHLNPRELARYYRGARFVVVPSRWCEVFGLVAAEAMMHGLPVIAARSGALSELVEDGETGLVFEPGNARDLAVKMAALWNSPMLCGTLGAQGRKKAQELYTPDAHYRRLMSAYRSATSGERVVDARQQQGMGVL
ncbi:MAG: glycosyltransferase [Candidatus Hydrogenedentales bacterium]|jgi:glycosyltransferase involved in cell wall biosynthesis